MDCVIPECDRSADYKKQQVCQKHYFRFMRNGSYEPRQRKYRIQNPAGYQKLSESNHPLANKDGYVYEHRFVVYNHYGTDLPSCELCGKATDWETCHIDHKDNDVSNNLLGNLRPVCRPCNTMRGSIKTPGHVRKIQFQLHAETLPILLQDGLDEMGLYFQEQAF